MTRYTLARWLIRWWPSLADAIIALRCDHVYTVAHDDGSFVTVYERWR